MHRLAAVVLLPSVLLLISSVALAQEGVVSAEANEAIQKAVTGIDPAEADYRTFLGMDSRLIVWIVAQLHLMFGAFVLAVPIFAVIVESIGVASKDRRYDDLAHEFTRLLVAAFATTAALGGLLTFTLFGLFPSFMRYLTGIFHGTMYVYALLFFGEAFSLYLYYYSWETLRTRKWLHISLGILLNLMGTALMVIANSWLTFMMSPTGIETETGRLISLPEAFANPLWSPINVHRLIANVCFGGFVVGAYAAVKFLGSRTEEERAHYDWMGYVGNFIGIAALIPLPFAGYWLGREIYSFSAVMGNNMMGGAFSWTFIIQAILIGMLFVGANYYLWTGMSRIPGSERYIGYIKYLNIILLVCFTVWLTPHNLPLSAKEQIQMGGQYHPLLKYLGLMSAKNAAVNFIILATFFSFLLYRRANRSDRVPFSEQSTAAKSVLLLVGAVCILFSGAYAHSLLTLDPATLDLGPEKSRFLILPALLVVVQAATLGVSGFLTFRNRGILGQAVLFAITVLSAVFVLGVYGFVVMTKANPFLRNIAVCQVVLVLSCLVFGSTIDVVVFRKAKQVGKIAWGKIPVRSQYALILLCVSIVMLMGLMGFIRSGLREDWHVYGVIRDTSQWAFTPSMAVMSRVVALIVVLFLGLVTFVFWLGGLGQKGKVQEPQG